jgi:hypothetical protein
LERTFFNVLRTSKNKADLCHRNDCVASTVISLSHNPTQGG